MHILQDSAERQIIIIHHVASGNIFIQLQPAQLPENGCVAGHGSRRVLQGFMRCVVGVLRLFGDCDVPCTLECTFVQDKDQRHGKDVYLALMLTVPES